MYKPPSIKNKAEVLIEYFSAITNIKKYILPVFLGVISILIVQINLKFGEKLSFITFLTPICVAVFLFAFIRPKYIYILTLAVSFFIFYLYRFLGVYFGIVDLPVSTLIDGIVFLAFIGMIYQELYTGQKKNWMFLINPVSFVVTLYISYILIQFFNPFQLSRAGWWINIRQLFVLCCCYLITIRFMDNKSNFLQMIVNIWIVFCSITAIYGCTQEWFGFMDMEQKWINFTTVYTGMIPFLHQGYMRKFSVFSDPTLFGVITAASSLLCFVLATGPFSNKRRIAYIIGGIVMILGMTYSGTRTAYAMFPVGLLLYFIMTLDNIKKLFILIILVVGFIGLMVAPIYGNRHINRIRSAFIGSEDASLNFRDMKRAASQEYIYSHPIGGGLETTGGFGLKYNKGHELNVRHIDSGFLKIALEIGWVGLLIYMLFFFCILLAGIYLYYRCQDKKVKVYLIAIVVFIVSCLVSMYTQKVIFQHPLGLFLFSLFAALGYLYKNNSFSLERNNNINS